MTAIETKYLGPTKSKGSRYVATTYTGHRIVLNEDTNLDDQENHKRAAKALRDKLGWGGCGPVVGDDSEYGMVWVFTCGTVRIEEPGRRVQP